MRRVYVMPSFVIVEKCDGCKALDKTACQYICPNDLMVLNPTEEGVQPERNSAGNATTA
jgi:hypothetical protein